MTIIERSYLRDFLYSIFVITMGLSIVFAVFDLIDKLDELIRFNPSMGQLSLYWLYIIPKYILYVLPITTLLCTILVFGQASRHKELIAIQASGGRIKKLFIPFIIMGFIFTLIDFAIGEFVSSNFTLKANDLRFKIINKKERIVYKSGNVWFKGKKGAIINAELYLPEKGLLNKVTAFLLKDGMLVQTLKADSCKWDGRQWILYNVKKYDLINAEIRQLNSLVFDDIQSPNIYNESELKPDEMSFMDLYRYNKRLRESGYKNAKIVVDMLSKISYPFTCFFTVLVGVAASSRQRVGGGLINTGIALVISFVYWIAYTMAISLGYSGIMSPVISSWIVPLLFGATGMYFYLKIKE